MAVILYAHPGAELYGSDRMAFETVLALVEGGHDVRAVLPAEGPLADRFRSAGIPIKFVPVPVLRKSSLRPTRIIPFLWSNVAATFKAIGLIRSAAASIVFVNTIVQPTWIIAGRLSRRLVICHVREAEKHLHPLIQRALALPVGLAHTVVSNSNSTRQAFEKNTTFRPRHSVVVYNGKDWSPYFTRRPRQMPTSPHIVVVGRLSPRKGQDVVIQALAKLTDSGLSPTLSLVGDVFPGYEWFRADLELLVAESGLQEQVKFPGFSSDIGPFLAAADIVIVPSREEPFGTVAAEGMASMRPTIVSDTGGLPEIVTELETGLLVECGDPEDLARAVRSLIDDPELSEQLAVAGFNSVHERFSAAAYGREVRAAISLTTAKMRDS